MKWNPLVPFEPTSTEIVPQGPQWVAQVKWDGVRLLTYYDGHEVRLFNRKLHERTLHYPEVAAISSYCSAHDVILDGEIIALGEEGTPSFYEVMRRDGIRRMEKVSQLIQTVPITYMVFDMLYVNGEWITDRPLSERQQRLQSVISPTDSVQLAENFPDAAALYQVMQTRGMEGVVAKDLTSSYVINGKDQRWQKKKCYRDLIAVVGGVTLRDQIANSLLLGLYDQEERFWYIGHAGTGKLGKHDWRALTHYIKPLVQSVSPFVNQPSRIRNTLWLRPELTVKIRFAEWRKGHSLRQPSIQAFVDFPAKECVLP